MADKYIVFNRATFEGELIKVITHYHRDFRPMFREIELDDSVVIRLQDRFSAPAIQSYFDAVSNTLEVLEELGVPQNSDLVIELNRLRTWSFDKTQDAREFQEKKIPEVP